MLPYIAFCSDTKSYSVLYEHLSDMWLSTLEFGATQFYSCKEIAPKSPFLCVQAFPEWCAKAIRQLRTFPKAYLFPWMAHLNNKNNKHSVRHIMTTLRENKQRKLPFKIRYAFCWSCPSATLASQHGGFVPRNHNRLHLEGTTWWQATITQTPRGIQSITTSQRMW